MKTLRIIALLLIVTSLSVAQRVRIGAEVLLDRYLDSLRGKHVALICNQTSVMPNGVHLVDTLLHRGVAITALFAPEHGIRGTASAGAQIADTVDARTGLPIFSLYGKTQKPTAEMMHDVDVMIFDLQDVGARFYTYASTMSGCMEVARDMGKKIIILDRPNPIDGVDLEGPVLDMDLISFVGMFPIPVRHGLTLGELAKMIAGEGWLNYNSLLDMMVVPMEGWKRSMWYDQTGLPWVAPSPNMRTLATATVYPGTCFFEATNVSEGRGTKKPFEWIGAPSVNAPRLADKLNAFRLPGVRFEPVSFTPVADAVAAPNPMYKNRKCAGVYVHVTDRRKFKPVLTGLMMVSVFRKFPKFQMRQGFLDHLVGDSTVSEKIMRDALDTTIARSFRNDIDRFRSLRSKYLLYK